MQPFNNIIKRKFTEERLDITKLEIQTQAIDQHSKTRFMSFGEETNGNQREKKKRKEKEQKREKKKKKRKKEK